MEETLTISFRKFIAFISIGSLLSNFSNSLGNIFLPQLQSFCMSEYSILQTENGFQLNHEISKRNMSGREFLLPSFCLLAISIAIGFIIVQFLFGTDGEITQKIGYALILFPIFVICVFFLVVLLKSSVSKPQPIWNRITISSSNITFDYANDFDSISFLPSEIGQISLKFYEHPATRHQPMYFTIYLYIFDRNHERLERALILSEPHKSRAEEFCDQLEAFMKEFYPIEYNRSTSKRKLKQFFMIFTIMILYLVVVIILITL